MREYLAVTVLVCILTFVGVSYVTNAIANTMDNMANVVAESRYHG